MMSLIQLSTYIDLLYFIWKCDPAVECCWCGGISVSDECLCYVVVTFFTVLGIHRHCQYVSIFKHTCLNLIKAIWLSHVMRWCNCKTSRLHKVATQCVLIPDNIIVHYCVYTVCIIYYYMSPTSGLAVLLNSSFFTSHLTCPNYVRCYRMSNQCRVRVVYRMLPLNALVSHFNEQFVQIPVGHCYDYIVKTVFKKKGLVNIPIG